MAFSWTVRKRDNRGAVPRPSSEEQLLGVHVKGEGFKSNGI